MLKTRLVGAAALLAIQQLGCQAAVTVSPPVGPTPSSSANSTPSQSATASQSATETPPAESPAGSADLDIGSGTFFLMDQRAGLDGLDSYTQTLTVSFDGTANGRPAVWSTESRLHYISQPPKSVLTLTAQGDTAAIDPSAFAEWGGIAYQRSASGDCTVRPFEPDGSLLAFAEPAGLLPVILGADEVDSGEVDGTPAKHYAFDGSALLESAGTTTGEVWVATDGGYVVKFARTTTADPSYFGGGLDGTKTWDYRLSDINALTDFPLPAGCQLDAPIMPGATNVVALPRYTGFDTPSTVAEVIAYYKQQMPALGWAVRSEPFTADDRAAVEFAKGDQVLNLLITPGENGRRVDLALGGAG
jgi:hypothetical protein